MNPAPDHLDPKEATEAKLCAYLEGELGPEDRIEIERHIQANPQHRQLLVELAKTREWMRLLPRESAPSEIAEAFEAQVERSMLLDDRRDTSPVSRLPQYALVAAIVLIIAGLGVLIMVMLPSNKHYTLGSAPTSPSPANQPSTVPVDLPNDASRMVDRSMNFDKPGAAMPAPPPRMAPADHNVIAMAGATGGGIGTGPGLAMARRRDINAESLDQAKTPQDDGDNDNDKDKEIAAIKAKLISSGMQIPATRKTVCLIVSTPAPAATANQVRGFFSRNQVAFDNSLTNGTINSAPQMLAANNLMNRAVAGQQNLQNQQAQSQQAPAQVLNNANFAANNQIQTAQNAPRVFAMKSATTEPVTLAVPHADKDAEDINGQQIYVGHGLTPLQLELLHGTLATGGIDQTVKRLALAEPIVVAKATTAPVMTDALLDEGSGKIAKGQTLTVTVPQLVGPGIEKTNVVKVADDGTISLPMLDPIGAAGTSPAELQDRIAGKYREANLIPQATVTVIATAVPAIAATTLPTTQPIKIMQSPATQPSEVAAKPVLAPAATQPASTQPIDDGKVDVVVYVQHKS